jgi:RimJ/RimL family protein N-acetyltransferase
MTAPLLLDVPEMFESKRLLIRSSQTGDGAELHQAEAETFDQLKQWFGPWAKQLSTAEQVEERVRKSRAQFIERNELAYNCYLKEANEFVGRAWFSRTDWNVPKCMFGMWVRSSLQRNGLGLEIALAFVRVGIEQIGFKRVEIYIDPRNQASLNLFERVGFHFEGTLRNHSYDNSGVLKDYLVYSLVPADMTLLKERHKTSFAAKQV